MLDLDREIKAAQERLHRSIGQKCGRELRRIWMRAYWHRAATIDVMLLRERHGGLYWMRRGG